MPHVVTQPCSLDGACIEVCPVDCIWPHLGSPESETHGLVFIDPNSCIDCGACAAVCPVGAIVPSELLVDHNQTFADLNKAFFDERGPFQTVVDNAESPQTESQRDPVPRPGPFHVIVVGAGPAGCYAAEALLDRFGNQVFVTVLEQATVPGGLARFGVAPDHVGTRRMARTLEAILIDPRVEVAFNVKIGEDMDPEELLDYADAVIWATGATQPKELVIPGDHLAAVEQAIEIARWYNGDLGRSTTPEVVGASQVVVIGNGNVGLDIARMLLMDPETLLRTEAPSSAIAALGSSAVKEVIVLGRRDPDHAAHSASEVLALAAVPGFDIIVDRGTPLPAESHTPGPLARAVDEIARTDPGHKRRLVLRYSTVPVAARGRDRVESLLVRSAVDGTTEELNCQAIVTAIGTEGRSQVPAGWGIEQGHAANADGRVLDPAGEVVPHVYVTGWMKRGASGGIGTNKRCAQRTVSAVVDDLRERPVHGEARQRTDSLVDELRRRGVHLFGLDGWKAIDRAERAIGAEAGAARRTVGPHALEIGLQAERT